MSDAAERLFHIFSNPDFLAMKGLANEAPIFIHAYDPSYEDKTRLMVENLKSRLSVVGVALVVVDLFDLILDHLVVQKRLQPIIDREAAIGKQKLLELLSAVADPSSSTGRLIPQLIDRISGTDVQLTLLTGVGRVFPFLRTHTILEALQPAMPRHPIVLFFPGDYSQDGNGSQLHLFGSQPNPKLSRAYYRAINLADYSV